MWYTLGYAKTPLDSSIDRGRTADLAGRVAVGQCRSVAPRSTPAGQCAWPDRARDGRGPGRRRSDRPPCHSRLQYPRTGRADAPVLRATAEPSCGLRSDPARAVARLAAPEPTSLRPTDQPVDLIPGRRGGVGRGDDFPAGQRRNPPSRAGTPGRAGEAGQTRDHQPRPGVCPGKKPRARLMHLAAPPPAWGLGCGDEVWWSRLAQPALHAWAPDAQALRLGEKALSKDDPDPKALAC
jgi:hypothetical protein